MKSSYFTILLALTCSTATVFAGTTRSDRKNANSIAEQLAGFSVPDGFIVELVASEKDGLMNPIDLAFDDAGQLWTQTARMYPLDPTKDIKWNDLLKLMDDPEAQDNDPEFKRIKDLYKGKTKGIDDILVISDIYEKGPIKVKKFATGLTIPQSILPYQNGAYVMQGSELFYLEDTNNDGISDKRIPVLTGFGFTDTHTMGHCLVRSPGGWVVFSQGALNKGEITAIKSGSSIRIDYSKIARFSLDGKKVELVTEGLNNIWGLQIRSSGQLFMTEANDNSNSVTPADPYTNYWGIGADKLREYQPEYPKLHKFRVGGTGLSGLAFSDDLTGKFAEEYKNVAFIGNPITSRINNVRIISNPDGTVTAEHLPDFLVSNDDWFRPVHIDFGPDGNLYVVDWYNKIISHNEVRTSHPDRDKSHGRIWRIRPKNADERKVPNLYKVSNQELIAHLQAPSAWERKAAWQQIADRQAKELTPQLREIVADITTDINIRIPALWSLESLGDFDQSLFTNLANDKHADMRRETLRALVTLDVKPEFLASILKDITNEPHVHVRSQAIRSIEQLAKTNQALVDIAVSFCRPAAKNNNIGDGYNINFERYLARRALEVYPEELKAYLNSPQASKQPRSHITWASQALDQQTTQSILAQWEILKKQPLTKETLILIGGLQKDIKISRVIRPYFSDSKNATHIANLALKHIPESYTGEIGYLLAETAMTLVSSNKADNITLGLKLAKAYRITHLFTHFASLLPETTDAKLKQEIITTLSYYPSSFAEQFVRVMTDPVNSLSLRVTALSGYVQATQNSSLPQVKVFLNKEPNSINQLIAALGETTQGNAVLIKLVADNTIEAKEISNSIAERIQNFHPQNIIAKKIYEVSKQRKSVEEKAIRERIPQLVKYIDKNPGNLATGKAIFSGMCLSCHVVGEEGVGIGPALGGAKNKVLDHLLTAVLLPDDAAENAYILFRVTETTGQITEGLKIKQTNRGTTIGHQGGVTSFIPARIIKNQEHVGSQSFMPSGQFDKLSDPILTDIISYMKTL